MPRLRHEATGVVVEVDAERAREMGGQWRQVEAGQASAGGDGKSRRRPGRPRGSKNRKDSER